MYVISLVCSPLRNKPELHLNISDLIPTMYDPACFDRVTGWETTLKSDAEFQKVFVKEYDTDDINQLLRIIKKYIDTIGLDYRRDKMFFVKNRRGEWKARIGNEGYIIKRFK